MTSRVHVRGFFWDSRNEEKLDFAEFLALRDEKAEWRRFGLAHLGRAYSDDEPEYTLADLKPRATLRAMSSCLRESSSLVT